MNYTPFLVRVAGLPTKTIEHLGSPELLNILAEIEGQNRKLDQLRAKMIDSLFAQIGLDAQPHRRFYLNLKRACYNGRQILPLMQEPEWELADPALKLEAEEIAANERQMLDLNQRFDNVYRAERLRNHEVLIASLRNAELLRAIALSSDSLASNLKSIAKLPHEIQGKKDRQLALALLSYCSRCALKLSPFSTFTKVGLALTGVERSDEIRYLPGAWNSRGLIRVKRYLIELIFQVLAHHPELRRQLQIRVNPTIRRSAPGRCRFISPGRWTNSGTGGYLYQFENIVTLRIEDEMVDKLIDLCGAAPIKYQELVQALSIDQDSEAVVDRLLTAGLIIATPLWSNQDVVLEQKLLEFVKEWGGMPTLGRKLEELYELKNKLVDCSEPLIEIHRITKSLDEIWGQVNLAAAQKNAPKYLQARGQLNEDVFVINRDEAGEMLRLPPSHVQRWTSSIQALDRFSDIFWHGYDFLHSLGALMQRTIEPVSPFDHLLVKSLPLWKDYVQYDKDNRPANLPKEPFNPYSLPEVARLHALRIELRNELENCVSVEGDEAILSKEMVAQLAARVPSAYISPFDSCLFLQPADPSGDRWVLNRTGEGTGRLGSRFVPLMPERLQRQYLARAERQGLRSAENAALMDVGVVNGDTLNTHSVQTPYILELPGNNVRTSLTQKLTLQDLLVQFDPDSRLPKLVLRKDGTEILPVHLGGSGHDFLPTVAKFLCVFARSHGDLILPDYREDIDDGIATRRRLVSGCVVLERKSWEASPARVPVFDPRLSESDLFRSVDAWRKKARLPEQVFLRLDVQFDKLRNHHKPQYIDFSSPLFVRLFQAMLSEYKGRLFFYEMLPHYSSFPLSAGNLRWGLEVLADPLLYSQRLELHACGVERPPHACKI